MDLIYTLLLLGFCYLLGDLLTRLSGEAQQVTPKVSLGFAFLIVLGQVTYAAGVPLAYGPIIVGPLCIVALIIRGRVHGISASQFKPSLRWVSCSITAVVFMLPVVLSGRSSFHGYLWGDSLHYDLLACYLHTPYAAATGLTPHANAVLDTGILDSRLGQSYLQALLGALVGRSPMDTFFLTGVMSAVVICEMIVQMVGRSSSNVIAAAAGIAAACSAACHLLVYCGFQSQTVASALLLTFVWAISNRGKRSWLQVVVVLDAILLTYPEFVPILMALVAVVLACNPKEIRAALALLGAIGGTFALYYLQADGRFSLLSWAVGSNTADLNHVFADALSTSGLAAIAGGEWPALLSPGRQLVIAVLFVGTVAFGIIGLAKRSVGFKDSTPVALLALAAAPWFIASLGDDRRYQFYKMLLTTSPAVLGFGVATLAEWFSFSRRYSALIGGAAFALILLGGLGVSLPVAAGRSSKAMLADFLHETDWRKLRSAIEEDNAHVLVSTPVNQSYLDRCRNGLVSLMLAKEGVPHQIAFISYGDPSIKLNQELMTSPFKASVPLYTTLYNASRIREGWIYLLQSNGAFLRPAETLFEPVSQLGDIHVFRRRNSSAWAYIQCARTMGGENPAALPFLEAEQTMIVSVESDRRSEQGMVLKIETDFSSQHVWHVYSSEGFGYTFEAKNGQAFLSTGPLGKGITEVYITRVRIDPNDKTRVKIERLEYGASAPEGFKFPPENFSGAGKNS